MRLFWKLVRLHRTNTKPPTLEISQGSNSGPLTIYSFIDDPSGYLECYKLLFADNINLLTISTVFVNFA